jgi:hypothetical protein
MSSASSLYRRFRGTLARKVFRTGIRYGKRWLTEPARANILIPTSIAIVGRVNAIEYDCTRDGQIVKARHVFAPGSRPMLAVGDGRGEIFLIGTRYRFTDRGIVDFNARGQAIDYHEDTGKTYSLKGFS